MYLSHTKQEVACHIYYIKQMFIIYGISFFIKKKIEKQHDIVGAGQSRAAPGVLASPAFHGPSSTFVNQNIGQYTFPNSSFG